jgi:hypothetical protein
MHRGLMRIVIVGLCTTGIAIVGYGDSPDDILAKWGTAFPHLTYLAKSSSGTNRWYLQRCNPAALQQSFDNNKRVRN